MVPPPPQTNIKEMVRRRMRITRRKGVFSTSVRKVSFSHLIYCLSQDPPAPHHYLKR
jgi:hypothetical protein